MGYRRKGARTPVYQLLGGKVRDRVRIYCDSGAREMIPGDERSIARMREIQEMGFTAAKIDIDDATDPSRFDRVNWTADNNEIDHMMAKVAFTREHYPKHFDLAVDMHARYDATTGKRVAKEVEPFNSCGWKSRCRLKTSTRCATSAPPPAPPSAAEKISTCVTASAKFWKSAPPTSSCPTSRRPAASEARKIADMAHAYYVPVAPHAVTSPIGMMATAHVCAAIPNFLVQEWHWIDSPELWRNWVKEGEIIQKGYITPPERAGLGVEMNDDGARKAQVPGTPWFEKA